ncbi:MAG: hypothetical protein QHH10_08415 [Peptococcaceae bacterium]|nr:hypothetical protein [Peptococcaceae bacterium]MDH7525318.1 hypothetical protein [Peptococcaceae bacterium]
MKKKGRELQGEACLGGSFVPTELGSARFASVGTETCSYRLKPGPDGDDPGAPGPPWGVEPSMHFVCDEAGIDYREFIDRLRENRSDAEMAREFEVSEQTVSALREHFYRVEAIHGNYGQD